MRHIAPVKIAYALSWIVAGILLLLPFHELLSIWIGSKTGHLDLIRIWKDILIVLLLVPTLWLAISDKKTKAWLLNSWIVRLFVVYVLLHAVLGAWAYHSHRVNSTALIYALIINLRFIYFFLLCAVIAAHSSFLKDNWARIVLWPAAVVVGFGLVQKFLLPYDFLKHFGYGPKTIPAYQTVDSNIDYQRVQSTLRGANPLGAYLLLISTGVVAATRLKLAYKLIYSFAVIIVLYFSYSRSAWLGLLISLVILAWMIIPRQKINRFILPAVAAILIVAGSLYALRSSQTVQDSLLHTSSNSANQSSNQARSAAIKQATKDVWHQPLGGGPGTAGPASYRNTGHDSRIAEDYYLQIGQEVGILGIAIFVTINILVGRQLWLRRQDVLAQVLLASLLGISFVNLLSHSWADDTLSLLWWGLAGIALAPVISKRKNT